MSIKEVWGEPGLREPTKNKRTEQDRELPAKRTRTGMGSPTRLTNLRRIENKVVEGPVVKDMEYMPELDWDKIIREHRENIEREQREITERLNLKEKKEQSWALTKLCHEFLEENNEKWAKRKEKREQDNAKVLRLEKAGIKGRNAKLEELRKNVRKGMEKLPEIEREKIEKEENKRRNTELHAIKKDLWTLKRFENKEIQNESTKRLKEIRELGDKAKKIKEVLDELRKRREQEKAIREREQVRREQYRKDKAIKEQRRKEKIELQKRIHERWALMKWTTEYIAENNPRWEKERVQREQEREAVLQAWDKRTRFEKIAYLREKMRKKKLGELDNETKIPEIREKTWNVWRQKKQPDTPIRVPPQQEENENIGENKLEVVLKPAKVPPTTRIAPIFTKMAKKIKETTIKSPTTTRNPPEKEDPPSPLMENHRSGEKNPPNQPPPINTEKHEQLETQVPQEKSPPERSKSTTKPENPNIEGKSPPPPPPPGPKEACPNI